MLWTLRSIIEEGKALSGRGMETTHIRAFGEFRIGGERRGRDTRLVELSQFVTSQPEESGPMDDRIVDELRDAIAVGTSHRRDTLRALDIGCFPCRKDGDCVSPRTASRLHPLPRAKPGQVPRLTGTRGTLLAIRAVMARSAP
jgi:hypothetical protein